MARFKFRNHSYNLKRDKKTDQPIFCVKSPQPSSADLRPVCPPIYDQGNLGSCTANAVGGAYHFLELKQQNPGAFMPSRLFIYYCERAAQGDVNDDTGSSISEGISVLQTIGVCPEVLWPYNTAQFAVQPPQNCYSAAKLNEIISYQRINDGDLNSMKAAIASGFPVAFGFQVYQSFESQQVASTGVVPMPGRWFDKLLGGHAVCLVGYNDAKQVFIVRNSWGTSWGMAGYFTMPYKYIGNPQLANDFALITKEAA